MDQGHPNTHKGALEKKKKKNGPLPQIKTTASLKFLHVIWSIKST